MIQVKHVYLLLTIVLPIITSSCNHHSKDLVSIYYDQELPQATFAVEDIRQALTIRGLTSEIYPLSQLKKIRGNIAVILGAPDHPTLQPLIDKYGLAIGEKPDQEGFRIRVHSRGKGIWILGNDPAGLMYGGLELAEQIRIGGIDRVQAVDQDPYFNWRGTKFNIPLDARTPSYTDPCDAAQMNLAEMWNMNFWKEYIDNLARHRYNFISLWSLHPFPSMVKVPEYPDVALDDVKRSTVKWKEYYSGNGIGFDAPEILDSLETLKKIKIEEKIDFWRDVMQYAKKRNVTFYVVTWNTFVNGTYGQYGITDDIHNPVTTDYFRKSVKQMFLEYPLLGGIGLTTGENMQNATFEEKELWAFNTYGRGVLDATKEFPDRKISFIHRQHQTRANDIAAIFKPLLDHENVDFLFSFKYAQAHVYSSTNQPFHADFVKDIQGMETIWTLRNDDVYYFRWGAPDFVREFIQNIPYEVTRGFYLGSDQYVWGREFLSKVPESPREIEISKHWYHWMIWGRLGYNPQMGNDRLIAIIQNHFPGAPAESLFTAWQEASMIYPKTTGFHWGALDFQWYIEGCRSRPGPAQTKSGFHDVNRFITLPPHPGTDYISIPEYVKLQKNAVIPTGTTPLEVSRQIHSHADRALQIIDEMEDGGDRALKFTLNDIRSMAYLGKYYAHKIRGATELALYREFSDPSSQKQAIAELVEAARFWSLYANNALQQYENPLWTNRVGYVDWIKLFDEVKKDIAVAGGDPESTPIAPISPADNKMLN